MIYLFYLYVLLIPLEYIQDKIPKGPTGVNYLNITLLVMLLWWLARGGRDGRRHATPTPLNLLLFTFLGYSYLGLFLTSMNVPGSPMPFNPNDPAFMWFIRLANGMLFFWLGANMMRTRRDVRWCLYAVGLSMPLVWRAFRSDIGIHSTTAYHNLLRFSGPFKYIGSNELAALFLIGCIFFGLFALAQRRWWEKVAYLTASGLYAYGVLYSYSRAAQLALVCVAVVVASLRYRWVLAILVVALMTQHWWVPVSVRERWEMTEDEQGQLDESAESRKEFWALAWDLFLHSPVYGHGTQSFRQINPRQMDTHNIYLRVMAEQGTIGAILFVAIWFHVFRLAYTLWTRAPERWDRQFGFALFMTTIGLLIANLFGDRFSHLAMIGQYWVIAGLAQRVHANMTGVEVFADDPESAAGAVSGTGTTLVGAGGVRALNLVSPAGPASKVAPAVVQTPGAAVRPTPARASLNIVGRNATAEEGASGPDSTAPAS
jgi:O-antigen ligase